MYWTATIKKIRTFLDKKKPKQTKLKKTSNMPEEKKTNLRTSEGAFRNTPLNQKNQLANLETSEKTSNWATTTYFEVQHFAYASRQPYRQKRKIE